MRDIPTREAITRLFTTLRDYNPLVYHPGRLIPTYYTPREANTHLLHTQGGYITRLLHTLGGITRLLHTLGGIPTLRYIPEKLTRPEVHP